MLLGGISLSRLPVDLLPDISQPTVNVRVNYTGVGPLEMEELITRPLEQQVSAVPGLERDELDVARGQRQHPAELRLGHGPHRSDERHPHAHRSRARPPAGGRRPAGRSRSSTRTRSRSWAWRSRAPTATRPRRSCASWPRTILSPRLERVAGVAAVTVGGGLRRQIHVDLSREKITALDLSVDRVVSGPAATRTRTSRSARSTRAIARFLLRSQGQFQNIDQIRNLVVLTKNGVPGLPARTSPTSRTRPRTSARFCASTASPACACRSPSSRAPTRSQIAAGRARRDRADQPRGPGRASSSLLDDSAKFIERSISAVQEHAMIGSVLVVLIIFLFLRNFRSTLIVCTSIPISVIGTFALLYFGGLTLNTMTFGGLALGVGMIVDAAIVVLENSFRHMEHHGKDRMTGVDRRQRGSLVGDSGVDPDAHRGVRAAALPRGRLEHHVPAALGRRGASRWRCRCSSRSRSCRCCARGCSCCRRRPRSAAASAGSCTRFSERFLEAWTRATAGCSTWRWPTGRSWSARPPRRSSRRWSIFPTLPTELATQTDEGQVRSTSSSPRARASRSPTRCCSASRAAINRARARSDRRDHQRRRRRRSGRRRRRQLGQPRPDPDPAQAEGRADTRSSDQIAQDLRRQLSGIPGVIVRANASGGNNQMNRFLSGGNNGGGRLVARNPRRQPRRRAQGRAGGEGPARHRAGRRRRAARPRRRASGTGGSRRPREGGAARRQRHDRGEHDSDQRRRHAGGAVPPGAATNIRSSSGCAKTERQEVGRRRRRAGQHAARARCSRRRT